MVSYYNPLGVYQKGAAQCAHAGWYQPPMLEEGGAPWHAHGAHAGAHAWQGAEWVVPDRPGSAPPSPRPGSPAHRPPPPRSPYEWMKKPSYQSQPNPGKTRTKDKYRVVYTDHQRLELEKEFHYSRYITIRRKAELAANLGLSERQVKIWFQNRRAKERKQVKKREEVSHKDKIMDSHPSLHQLHQHSSLHHQQAMIHQGLAHQGLSHQGLGHQGLGHQGLGHPGLPHQGMHQGLHQGLGSQPLHGVPPVQLI